jgi:hypothetical protein
MPDTIPVSTDEFPRSESMRCQTLQRDGEAEPDDDFDD